MANIFQNFNMANKIGQLKLDLLMATLILKQDNNNFIKDFIFNEFKEEGN